MPKSRVLPSIAAVGLALIAVAVFGPAGEPSVHADEHAAAAQGRYVAAPGAVLPRRQRVEPVNRALEERLETLLPALMRESGLDMWLVINREYAEDPVYFSLVPEPVHAARRTTMLVFHDRGQQPGPDESSDQSPGRGVERLTVSRYPMAGLYEAAWEGGDIDEQWERLAEVVRERDPGRIGVNTSREWAVADGLTAGLERRLRAAFGPDLARRLESAETLVVRWLETRGAAELALYPHVVALARSVISEAFSEAVITPGATTTDDVAWFIRQRFADLDLPVWFMPYVNLQRPGSECERDNPFCGETGKVIERGDVLHTDVGICYLRLCTDTQEMGYVLRLGEETVPAGLAKALADGNRWQDLLTGEFRTGRTGNEIFAAARLAAESSGLAASIYTHPLGVFGHAPGPTIGMWDNQGPTPVKGDWKLRSSTAYAIEGNVKVQVPEWEGQWVQIKLEQSALFDGASVRYLAGRQTEWHLIR